MWQQFKIKANIQKGFKLELRIEASEPKLETFHMIENKKNYADTKIPTRASCTISQKFNKPLTITEKYIANKW